MIIDFVHIWFLQDTEVEEQTQEESADNSFVQQPIRTKRNLKKRDQTEEQALKFLNMAASELTKKDDCTIFGEMVASQLRKLNKRNQAVAKHEINNLLFKFEMVEIENSSSQIPTVGTPNFQEFFEEITEESQDEELQEELQEFITLN